MPKDGGGHLSFCQSSPQSLARSSCVPHPIITASISHIFSHNVFSIRPLVWSLCVSLFTHSPLLYHWRFPIPSTRRQIPYNLDNAGRRLQALLSLFKQLVSVWGTGARTWHPSKPPTHVGLANGGRKGKLGPGKTKLNTFFVEHGGNWSRNNLIASLKICLDFPRTLRREEGGKKRMVCG